MSLHQEKTREYTYRIDIDDSRAMRKIHRLQALDSGYHIYEIPDRDVPNKNAAHNWGFKYYKSKEMRDFETGNITGGTIPGLGKYRYSLEWEATPDTNRLEMRHANGGGTKIKGRQHLGTSDPRLPNDVPVDTVVPWTPGEIKDMFDGEPVPNRVDYSHDPPDMTAGDAQEKYRDLIRQAMRDGLKRCKQELQEYVENCDHDHVVTTEKAYQPEAYCEDCGREWIHADELEACEQNGELTIVGEV